jgi:hypothetical protein
MLSRRLRDAQILHRKQQEAKAKVPASVTTVAAPVEAVEEIIEVEEVVEVVEAKPVLVIEETIVLEPAVEDPEDGADDEINLEELSDAARELVRKSLRTIRDEVDSGLWDQHLDVLLVLEQERTQGPRAGLLKIVNERLEDIQAQ